MASMTTTVSCFLGFIILSFSLLLISTSPAAAASVPPGKIVTKLIHRDSIFSPFYNPSSTTKTSFSAALNSSEARLAFLNSKLRSDRDARADLIPDAYGATFMANVSLGQPPVPQLVSIDTGSNMFWVKCSMSGTTNSSFDPIKSSTYNDLRCGPPPFCLSASHTSCDPRNDTCNFSIDYEDGTHASGKLATETLTFQTLDDGETVVPSVVFGCGTESQHVTGGIMGVLGLGSGPISLVTEMGSKFSYCFGKLTDIGYPHNRLVLGDGSEIEGDPTGIEIFNSVYYLDLQGISIDGEMLDIIPEAFKRDKSRSGGTIIDSGTTITYLTQPAFQTFTTRLDNLLQGIVRREKSPSRFWEFCYEGNVKTDLIGFPVVTFHFSGGAELGLDVDSLFRNESADQSLFCLAVHPNDRFNVVGALAQQGYNVGYDLQAMMVYFQRIDCELLES